ncbi:hypothetical protein HG536_0F04110 [Torulaspora globosa]|uniref:Ribonuclease P/MRP protein subunit POP5 n=1 Tax=Torulaspora globosa TaxID=48254 RepID=A0A7G3ZKP9_9SACH|nr:uncharacterized protein HG536_0F04110 [Torulaspora globosa]QLL34085.1 hypothetical protein HG536_0F04110 [Torulaspora globosa]
MVRLKSRYILFEILYPDEGGIEGTAHITKRDILLRLHRVSPPDISIKSLLQEIRRSLQVNFGDYGSGKANSLLQVKYFSNMTSTGILRCHREDCDLLVAALALITKVGDVDGLMVNPIKMSGTIKKIEEYAGRRSEKLLSVLKQNDEIALDNFHDVSEDEDQEE